MSLIVAGIHTGIGKTICSTVLCQALGYDYWKPVQAGNLEDSDSIVVKALVTHPKSVVHPEKYRLKTPASPHYAAKQDGLEIKLDQLRLPDTENKIVVETAGGLMSPFSLEAMNVDLAHHFQLPVVLVSNDYLGSINHTLLSVEALRSRNVPLLGLVFCGEEVPSTRSFILSHTQLPLLFTIPTFEVINKETISSFSKNLSFSF